MSNRIAETRKKKGLTLRQLGDMVGLGDNTISRYETGKREPKLETWQKLADALGVSVPYLQGIAEYDLIGGETLDRAIDRRFDIALSELLDDPGTRYRERYVPLSNDSALHDEALRYVKKMNQHFRIENIDSVIDGTIIGGIGEFLGVNADLRWQANDVSMTAFVGDRVLDLCNDLDSFVLNESINLEDAKRDIDGSLLPDQVTSEVSYKAYKSLRNKITGILSSD